MKKLLSVVLALVMVFTFMVPAFAEGTTVVYYVDGVQEGAAVAATAGDIYTPDRMPTAAAPAGQYFVGWANADGKIYAEGFTLAEGENKLTAVYKNYPEVENVNLKVTSTDLGLVTSTHGIAAASYLEGSDPAYAAKFPAFSTGPHKKEYVEATEDEVAYLKLTDSTYRGNTAFFLADENGYAIQGEWGKTYYIRMKFRIPYNEKTIIDAETGEATQSPEVGIVFNTCFGLEIDGRNTNYKNTDGIGFGKKGLVRGGLYSTTLTPNVDYTTIWDDSWGNSKIGIGANKRNSSSTNYSENYTTDGWQEIVFQITTPAAANAAYLPVFILRTDIDGSNAATTIVNQELDIAELQVIDSTKASVEYVVNGEVESTVTGLTAGSAYNIDRVPTAAAPAGKYFAGWVDENGAAITSSYKADGSVNLKYTLAAGTNKFYAKYVDYATTFKPHYLNQATALAAGKSSAGLLSNTISSSTTWSNTNYDTTNGIYSAWTTQTYTQENIILLTDENGVAYQAEPNSTYKITVRAKGTAPNIDAINAANAAAGATKVYTVDDVSKNQINFGIGLKVYPDLRSGNYGSAVHSATGVDIAHTSEYVDYTFTVTTGNLEGVNPQMMMRITAKPTLYLLNSANENNGLATAAAYGKNSVEISDVTVEKVVGKVSYSVNGEAFGEKVDNLTIGDMYTIDRMPENTATHYFSGWYFDEACTQYARATFTVPTEPVTLYAKMVPYAERVHLSSSGAEGTISLANYKFYEREGNWTNSYLYYTGYYKMVDGVYKDYIYGGYGKYIPNADGTVAQMGDTWNQPAAHAIVDETGDAIIPEPGARYRVTATMKTSVLIGDGSANGVTLQTGWALSKGGSGSKDGTFDANGYFVNWNSAWDYNPGGLENTSGAYQSASSSLYWNGEWQTLTFEMTMPTLAELKEKNLASFMSLKFQAPASPNTVIIKDIIVENLSAIKYDVNYIVDGETTATDKAGYASNYTVSTDIPTKAGYYFTGWYTNEACTGAAVKTIENVTEAINLYAGFAAYPGTATNNDNDASTEINYVRNDATDGYTTRLTRFMSGYGSWTVADGAATHQTTAGWGQASIMALVDANGNAIKAELGKTYKITLDVRGNSLDLDKLAEDYPEYDTSNWEVYSFNVGAGVHVTYKADLDNCYVTSNMGLCNYVTDSGKGAESIVVDDQWHTVSYYVTVNSFPTGYEPIFGIRSQLPAVPTPTGDYCYDYGRPSISYKNIIVEDVTADAFQTTTVGGNEASYVKIADYVDDNATYMVKVRAKSSAVQYISFMTADADNVNSNRGYYEGANASFSQTNTLGYATTSILYVNIDKKMVDGVAQGDALYLYIPGGVNNFELYGVEVIKLTNELGGNIVANGSVSMLADLPANATQALRYYFTYDTKTGSDLILNGNSWNIVERGFLIADASKYANEAVTLTTAKDNSEIIKASVSGDSLLSCWEVTDADADGINQLTFSTYIKGFKPVDETYNNTNEIYVKGYVVINIYGVNYVFYSAETVCTVKDVADMQSYHPSTNID